MRLAVYWRRHRGKRFVVGPGDPSPRIQCEFDSAPSATRWAAEMALSNSRKNLGRLTNFKILNSRISHAATACNSLSTKVSAISTYFAGLFRDEAVEIYMSR
jgi:hypothetical protein